MSSRFNALAWTAIFGVLSLMLAPLSLLIGMHTVSGGFIGLATLRQGAYEGGIVLVGALIMAGALVLFAMGTVSPIVVLASILWIPVWLMCIALRATSSPGLVIGVAAGVAGLGVLLFRFSVGDPTAWWMAQLEPFITLLMENAQSPDAERLRPQLIEGITSVAPVASGLSAAGVLFWMSLGLFVARWAHAILDNPGGFGQEFRAFALPRPVSWVALAVLIALLVTDGALNELAADLLPVIVVPHMLQGVAIAHSLVAKTGSGRGWLIMMYATFLFMPVSAFTMLLLAAVGFSDSWMRYRHRFGG